MRIFFLGGRHMCRIDRLIPKYLRRMGHEVATFDYRLNPSTPVGRLPLVKNHWVWPYVQRALPIRHKKLIEEAVAFKPDLIFTMKGESILPRWMDEIRQRTGAPSILWFFDDPKLFDSVGRKIALGYDLVATSGFKTVEKYRALGVPKVIYTTHAIDPEEFAGFEPTDDQRRRLECTASFTGSFYPVRRDVLAELIRRDPNLDLRVWGRYWQWPFVRGPLRKRCLGPIPFTDMCAAMLLSQVNVNVHLTSHAKDGLKANMRTYELAAIGAFQVSDESLGGDDIFEPGKEIVRYRDPVHLLELIHHYQRNPDQRHAITQAAHARVIRDYTYEKVLGRMLDEVFDDSAGEC